MKYTACILLFVSIFFGSYYFVFSESQNNFIISKNSQTLIDFNIRPKLKELYNKWVLKINTSTGSDIQLIQKQNKLVLWYPRKEKLNTGNFILSLKNEKISLPIEKNISKEENGFNMFDDMYSLSLQKRSLSCESSAASNILSSMLWKNISEDEVVSWLPKSNFYNKLPSKIQDDKLWGNPNSWFVGYIDHSENISAKQKLMTWYGVYERPIAEVYQTFGLNTQVLNKKYHSKIFTPKLHLRVLLKKLEVWSMVQLWWDWCTKPEYDDGVLEKKSDINNINLSNFISAKNACYNVDQERELRWKYYDKKGILKKHIGLDGQHAFILLWWKWNLENPSHIRVWDTDTWFHEYPTHEWMRKWKRMDYRSIIISKKEAL